MVQVDWFGWDLCVVLKRRRLVVDFVFEVVDWVCYLVVIAGPWVAAHY